MARTKDQSFVNRYLNQYQQNQKSAVSAGQQAASNAASSGVQQMNATGNIKLPSLYDPTEDLYGFVLDQQKAQIKAQQAAAKAAQKAQEKAQKEAQERAKEAASESSATSTASNPLANRLSQNRTRSKVTEEEQPKKGILGTIGDWVSEGLSALSGGNKGAENKASTSGAAGVPARSLAKTAAVERPASAYDAMTVTEKLTAAQQLSEQVQALQSQIDALERQKVEPKTGAGAYDEEAYSIIQKNRQIVEQQDALKAQQKQVSDQLSELDDALWKDPEYVSAVQAEIDAKSESERIAQYLDPSYKLNRMEEKDAKEIIKRYRKEAADTARWFSGATDEQRKEALDKELIATDLETKVSDLYAFESNFAFSVPGVEAVTNAVVKAHKGDDYDPNEDSVQAFLAPTRAQSPIASTAGSVAGNLASYAAGSQLVGAIPGVGAGLQSAGQAIGGTRAAQLASKAPVIGKAFTPEAITGILGDQLVDTVLDTGAGAVSSVMQGDKSGAEIAADAAKNFGTNLAFNISSAAVLGTAGDVLNRWKANRAVPSLEDDAANQAVNMGAGYEPPPSLYDYADNAAKAVDNNSSFSLDGYIDGVPGAANDVPLPSLENAVQAAQGGADDVVNAWRSGTLTNAQLETLKPGGVNRAAFEQATGVKLPDTSSETRQFLRQSAEIPSLEPDMPAGTVAASVDGVSPSVSGTVADYAENTSRTASSATAGPEIPAGYKERGFAESIRTKTDLPDEVKQEFVDNPELYRAISNSETSARADAIYSQGLDRSMVEYNRMLSQKDPAAVPLGKKIADELISQGRRDEAVDVLRQMSQNLTQSGQFSQAAAIALLKNDPMTALQYVQKNIDQMNKEGLKKFGPKKWKDFSLTPDEIDAFGKIEYGDEEAMKAAFEGISKRLSKEYPATLIQKLVEASHVAMLLNPRTQIRNAAANVAFRPLNILSRKVSAAGQNVYKFFNKDYQPNQAFSLSKQSKALANDAYKMVRDTISGNVDGKWENTILNSKNNADVFKLRGDTNVVSRIPVLGDMFSSLGGSLGKFSEWATGGKNVFEELSDEKSVAENIRRFTYGLLELGDEPFVRKEFVDRMASFIEARGYKSLDEVPEEAFDAATQSALKATFKDDNRLTRLVSSAKKETGALGEVLMPFTKTPANIAVRAFDYSPAGLVYNAGKWIANGGDPSAYIDEISKGLTGTAAVGLGWLLYKAGLITGPASENPDQAQYDKMQGKLPYSLKIGDNYYTFDWMQPASSALILGSTLASQAEKDGGLDGQSVSEAIKKSVVAMGDSLLNMSPLQSVSDVFGGYGTPTENLLNEFVEFPQRFIPSTLGAVARVADPVQRQTFSNGDTLATQIATAQSKIPGASQSLPAAYDTWGREITRADNLAEGIFNQFVNPGQTGNANPTPMDDEISRLFEATGQTGVFPQKANWSETYGGETHKLTNEQYSDYQRTMGQISYDGAFSLLDSEIYGLLDDQQKAKAIQSVYAVGRDKALQDIFPDYSVPETRQKQVEVYDTLGAEGLADWLNYKAIADADGNDAISQDEALAALNVIPSLDNDERAYFWYLTNSKWKKNPYM